LLSKSRWLKLLPMLVLVVDDHAEVRDLLRRALERDGHRVSLALTVTSAGCAVPNHAVRRSRRRPRPARRYGYELCRALRQRGSTLPILLLTAHGEVSQRVASLDAGADDFLSKPFAIAELRARVRALSRRGPLSKNLVYQSDELELNISTRRAPPGWT
jgi:DNA-binding response OmpR family regulator